MGALQRSFAGLVGDLDQAMLVVTCVVGGERAGCLVEFSTPASIDPPRFLVCLSKRNRTYRLAREAPALAVHLLASDATGLAELFGGETGDEVDKFARCSWQAGPKGLPIIEPSPAWFAGSVLGRLDAGDHEAFLLEPFEVHRDERREPLRAGKARSIDPGHEP